MACSNHHRTQSAIGGVPIHPMLVAFPIPFLMSALATDIAFWRNGDHHSLVLASMWALATAMMMRGGHRTDRVLPYFAFARRSQAEFLFWQTRRQ